MSKSQQNLYKFDCNYMSTTFMNTQTKIALLGVTGISLGLIAYRILKGVPQTTNNNKKSSNEKLRPVQKIISEQLYQLSNMQQLLLHKSSQFDVVFESSTNDQVLSVQCLLSFFLQTNDLFEDSQIDQIYAKSRQGRRKVFENLSNSFGQYFKFVCTLDQQIKYLIQKAQKDFVVFLNLDYSIVTHSIQYHIEDESFRESISRWSTEVRQIIKNQLPLYRKPVPLAEIQTIMEFQTSLLKQDETQTFLKQIVGKLGIQSEEEFECLPTFLCCYLEDIVFQKYGVELQQLNSSQIDVNLNLYNTIEQYNELQKKTIDSLYSIGRQNQAKNR